MSGPPTDNSPPDDSKSAAPPEAQPAPEPTEGDAEVEAAEASDAAAEPAKIDFDRAEFEEPKSEHVECGLCKRTIHTEYWQAHGKILCAACRKTVERTSASANGGAAFGKAFLYGGGAALACGTGYAIFVAVSNFQFALVTIGIGWAVGTAIQKVTKGFGGRKYQILAVALTYFATTMSYFPGIVEGLRDMGHEHPQSGSSAPGATSAPSPAPADEPAATTPDKAPDGAVSPARSGGMSVGFAIFLLVSLSLGLMLAAPFLALSGASGVSGLLGLLIIFFGLRMAWRISKGVETSITGPHQVGAADVA